MAHGGFDDVLDRLQDPASELSRQWDREHDEHITRCALQAIRAEFKPATWQAFHRLVLDEADPETAAAELGLSVNAVLIAKSRSPRPAAPGVERICSRLSLSRKNPSRLVKGNAPLAHFLIATLNGGDPMSDRAVTGCPDLHELRSFGLGLLTGPAAAVVEDHVSHCPDCCRTLQGVGHDTLTELVRGANAPADSIEAPTAAFDGADDGCVECPPALHDHPRYRVLTFLGKGGMGAVFKAEHKLMGRPVAIKVIRESLTSNPAVVERFRREVKAAARLAHPNIVAVHDAEQAGDTHFLVMEFVEGTDLARIVAERGRLPVAEACDAIRQAARGLQHAHERGMIHRDIKPHNLMRTPDGAIKILDFGLARLASEAGATADDATGQGVVLGTVDYMAPEQADSAHKADIRSDVYSLGCTLYFLLAGRPPFPNGTVIQKMMSHAGREPTPLDELRPDLPPALLEVLRMMTAKSPALRYQTPDEVDSALDPFASTRFGSSAFLRPAAKPEATELLRASTFHRRSGSGAASST